MFSKFVKTIALAVVVAAVAAPFAQAVLTASQTSRLGAQTEAAGYLAITKYLVDNSLSADVAALGARTEAKGFIALSRYLVTAGGLSAADVSRLGAQTEAQGYRAINTYLAQHATRGHAPTPSL